MFALTLAIALHPAGLLASLAALAITVPVVFGMCPSPSTVYPGVLSPDAIQKLGGSALVLLAASTALDPHTANRYMITKGSIAALTLAAPTAGVDDGMGISIFSSTAFAHTVTATGLLVDGAGHVNTATFPAAGGGALDLVAYNGKWYVQNSQNITFA